MNQLTPQQSIRPEVPTDSAGGEGHFGGHLFHHGTSEAAVFQTGPGAAG